MGRTNKYLKSNSHDDNLDKSKGITGTQQILKQTFLLYFLYYNVRSDTNLCCLSFVLEQMQYFPIDILQMYWKS
jgi:hypothetical protein